MESSDNTVEYVTRLPPYNILKGAHHEDRFVRYELESYCPETLPSLDEYTRGMYSTELHYASFMHYSRPVSTEQHIANLLKSNPFIRDAIILVGEQLTALPKVHLIPTNKMDTVKWIPSSAAGYNYIGPKRDNYPLARKNASRALYHFQRFGDSYRMRPDKAFARSQLALRASPKIRHVWGRAFHHILIESLIGQPLVDMLLHNDNPIYIGRNLIKEMPASISLLASDASSWYYCLDFSKFDASVNRYLVDMAWLILKDMLILEDEWEVNVYNYCRRLFTNTPVVMPDGRLYIVKTGIPSGSFFTQMIDSIVNLILIYALQLRFMGTTVKTYVLGDDSIFATPKMFVTLQEATDFFAPFRMEVSSKSVITNSFVDVIFLGHNFYGSRVSREEFTCLSLALFTEDEVKTPQETILRIASLLYDSGFNSHHMNILLQRLLNHYKIDWTNEILRPVSLQHPFTNLFVLS